MEDSGDNDEFTLAQRNFLLYNAEKSDIKFNFQIAPNHYMSINAHKKILRIGSCVFEQMFYGLMASTSTEPENIILITDISFECFKNLLLFIYIGAAELNSNNVLEVLYAAHKYEVCKLETLCCNFLYKSMDISNVLHIYDSSLVYNNTLTTHCLEWIDDLFEDLVNWEEFLNLKKDTLMGIIKRDSLCIGELKLFKAVYRWAEKQCYDGSMEPSDANIRIATDNFKHIRFPNMTHEQFSECARYGLGIFTAEEKVDVWDAISKVKQSQLFNSNKRILTRNFKTFMFSYYPQLYSENKRYLFRFEVHRIVYLISAKVIRNCRFAIWEKDSESTQFCRGYDGFVHANETKYIKYAFVPNVKYVFDTTDRSFSCNDTCTQCAGSKIKFANYNELYSYYNRIAKMNFWSAEHHDPFYFDYKQETLIRLLTYRLKK